MAEKTRLDDLLKMLGGLEEPLAALYADAPPPNALSPKAGGHSCLINYLRQARVKKQTVCFAADQPGCMGGWVYLGYILPPPDRIAHFVTTGLPGEEGERYLPSPDSMRRLFKALDLQPAPAEYCLVKPFSQLGADEKPLLIIFHGRAEVITGLCQLAYFALDDPEAVALPFGAGCTNIFSWPLTYERRGLKKAVVGGADPSCRPFMKVDELSFTVTRDILAAMLEAAPKSFLTGGTWAGVLKKIARSDKLWSK